MRKRVFALAAFFLFSAGSLSVGGGHWGSDRWKNRPAPSFLGLVSAEEPEDSMEKGGSNSESDTQPNDSEDESDVEYCVEDKVAPKKGKVKDRTFNLLQLLCKKDNSGCSFDGQILCLSAQSVAHSNDSYEAGEYEDLESKMNAYLGGFLLKVLGEYESEWVDSIKDEDRDFQLRVSFLTKIAVREYSTFMAKELKSFKQSIKSVNNDERKGYLIEMYSILKKLSEQVKQPTGSLRDFQGNIRSKVEEYKDLKTKLEFVE